MEHEVNGEMVGCNNKAVGNELLESAVIQALNDVSLDREAIIKKLIKIINEVVQSHTPTQYNFTKAEQSV